MRRPQLTSSGLLCLLAALASAVAADSETVLGAQPQARCVDYSATSQGRRAPFSAGGWRLPYQRPAAECRTFVAPEVEDAVLGMASVVKDPDLLRLFENTFPNTLDTTIRWHGVAGNGSDEELTFITTGDINAMWLRDSANQLRSYLSVLRPSASGSSLASLFRGAINLQARYILASPQCNAFQPPPESGIPAEPNQWAAGDRVTPFPDPDAVFECKWELDSVAAFLQLSADYVGATGDVAFFSRHRWRAAVAKLLEWAFLNQAGTYDDATGAARDGPYRFSRSSDSASETLANNGKGEPVSGRTGLVRSAFRPSDDATIFQLFIPANMMFAANLARCAPIARAVGDAALGDKMDAMAAQIKAGIEGFGRTSHRTYGEMYAYEVDGFGSFNMMDDANTPSLLSAPLLGYLNRTDKIYQNTRRFVLSTDNRYYMHGSVLNATGGPHVGPGMAWPMGAITAILTSDDDGEIRATLQQLISSTAGLGLMHESVNSGNANQWSRQWRVDCFPYRTLPISPSTTGRSRPAHCHHHSSSLCHCANARLPRRLFAACARAYRGSTSPLTGRGARGMEEVDGELLSCPAVGATTTSANQPLFLHARFSWANGLFGQMLLDLKERKPHLLALSYQPGDGYVPPDGR